MVRRPRPALRAPPAPRRCRPPSTPSPSPAAEHAAAEPGAGRRAPTPGSADRTPPPARPRRRAEHRARDRQRRPSDAGPRPCRRRRRRPDADAGPSMRPTSPTRAGAPPARPDRVAESAVAAPAESERPSPVAEPGQSAPSRVPWFRRTGRRRCRLGRPVTGPAGRSVAGRAPGPGGPGTGPAPRDGAAGRRLGPAGPFRTVPAPAGETDPVPWRRPRPPVRCPAPPGVRRAGRRRAVGAAARPPGRPVPRPARDRLPAGCGRWTDPGAVAAQEAQRARSSVDGLAVRPVLGPAAAPGQAPAAVRLAAAGLRALRAPDQPRGEPGRRPPPRADRAGQPAAARLLQDRDAEPQGRRRQDHDDRDARRHVRLAARRPGGRRRRQPGPRHAQPEDPAGDQRHRPAPAARRRSGCAATPTSAPTPRRARPGWRCWPASRTRRCPRRSARTTTGAR